MKVSRNPIKEIDKPLKLKENKATKISANQNPNAPYMPAQKILLSTAFFLLSSLKLSKIHSSVPSSLIWDHQRSPTKMLQRLRSYSTKYLPSSEIFHDPKIKCTKYHSNNKNKRISSHKNSEQNVACKCSYFKC